VCDRGYRDGRVLYVSGGRVVGNGLGRRPPPELLDEVAWSRLASGRRRPLAPLRVALARWLRAVAAWLDEMPDAAPDSALAKAR
jgi:hypothetical protein